MHLFHHHWRLLTKQELTYWMERLGDMQPAAGRHNRDSPTALIHVSGLGQRGHHPGSASSPLQAWTALLSRHPPSLFKGPRTHAANGRRTRQGTWWGLDVARTNRHDGTEQAGTCLQRTTIGRRLRKVDYDRLSKYPPALPSSTR